MSTSMFSKRCPASAPPWTIQVVALFFVFLFLPFGCSDTLTSISPESKRDGTGMRTKTVGSPEDLISDVDPSTYALDLTESGEDLYIDRDYTLESIPPSFQDWAFIQTANDDKFVEDESAVTFDLDEAATVALAYDKRGTSLPNWLDGWTDTGKTLGTTDVDRDIYTRVFEAGEVALGGNMSGGAEGAESMYLLFAAPSDSPPDEFSTLEVSASTFGDDQDTDGYTVTVDGDASKEIDPNGTVTVAGLDEGDHQVELSGIQSNCSVDGPNPRTVSVEAGGSVSASFDVNCTSGGLQAVEIPSQSGFTDRGPVLAGGNCGAWDWWMGSPLTVIREGGQYHLYYQAADGSRPDNPCSDDGQQRNRFLGLATASVDAFTNHTDWTKDANNPLIKHQSSGGVDAGMSGEGGIIGGASPGVVDGTFRLYFGGMAEFSYEAVDSDVVYVGSEDGVTWENQSDAGKAGTIDGNDENFPIGAIEIDGTYYVYYTAKGGDIANDNTVYLLSGNDPTDFGSNSQLVNGPDEGAVSPNSGGIIRKSEDQVLVTTWDFFTSSDEPLEVRSAPTSDLTDLTTVETTWDWPAVKSSTLYLDREADRWLLFYQKWSSDVDNPINPDSSTDEIWLKTAPVTYE